VRALLLLVVAGCGAQVASQHESFVPMRNVTGAAPLLALVPSGADAALELDLARGRADAAAAPLVARLPPTFTGVDIALAAVYRLGRAEPRTVFVLRGESLDVPTAVAHGGRALDDHTVVIDGIDDKGKGGTLATDEAFLRLRDEAMPEGATGAVVRLTARLDRDARIAAAGQLGVDEIPSTISLWGDVADDLAVVALLGEDDARAAAHQGAAVKSLMERMAPRFLGRELPGRLDVATAGAVARLVWHVGPKALAEWAGGS
jgi:hypothetical protein